MSSRESRTLALIEQPSTTTCLTGSPSVDAEAAIASPNTRWVLSGPFARIHYRDELLDDLEYAVKKHTGPTVLALFGFTELSRQLEMMLEPDGNLLLGRIAKRLADAAGVDAVLYEPRRGDFCALFSGELQGVQPLLDKVVESIDDETRILGIQTALGVVELPREAGTPVEAVRLADQLRREVAGEFRPRARQSVSTRVPDALGQPAAPEERADAAQRLRN